jgi:ribonuclease-3
MVIRRRASGGFSPSTERSGRRGDPGGHERDRSEVESGGFETEEPSPGLSPAVSRRPGRRGDSDSGVHAGVGVAVGPPTAEIEAAEETLCLNLDYFFKNRGILSAALTHPSLRHERPAATVDNQRLEFLGDLALGLAVGDLLLTKLPQSSEGEISTLKAALVREHALATIAEELHVGPALRLGRGVEATGGRSKPAVLADALEAVLGAVFVDSGYEAVRGVVERLLARPLSHLLTAAARLPPRRQREISSSTSLHILTRNYKTALQEWLAHAKAAAPAYRILCEIGPPDARRFRVEVAAEVAGAQRRAVAEGTTVKGAENAAAERLLAVLAAGEGTPHTPSQGS